MSFHSTSSLNGNSLKTRLAQVSCLAAILCAASGAYAADSQSASSPSPTPQGGQADATPPRTLLQEIVVTATRLEDTAAQVGSAFTKIDGDELVETQIIDAKRAVNFSPGAFSQEVGGRGAGSEIFIRGNRSDHTLILVDGVKANSALFNSGLPFLSNASALNLEDIEIVRGPQSMLFGSEALAGVVSLETKRGSGAPKATLFFEGGSYQSLRQGILSDGSLGKLDYSLHYAYDETANARVNNDFREHSGSLRLDYTVSDKLSFGLSMRTQVGNYQEPGSIRPVDYYNNLLNDTIETESDVFSAYINWKTSDVWSQKFTLGLYEERYFYTVPLPPVNPVSSFLGFAPSAPDLYMTNAANITADWQNTFQLCDANRLVAGIQFLNERGHDNSFEEQATSSIGFYTEDQWEVIHNLVLTGGVRLEHHDVWGDDATYRFSGAYLVDATRTKFHSSYGTGFKSPSFFQVYSTASFALGNPDLKPERSQSWDVGVDQYFLGDRLSVGVTYFQSSVDNLIAFVQGPGFTGSYANQDEAATHGIEFSATAKLTDQWQARFAYTWTDATHSSPFGIERPFYVPRHLINAETSYTFFGKLTLGGGIQYVAQRVAQDFSTGVSQTVNMEDYTVCRVFGRYDVCDHFAITARIENLFGEKYETRLGFPALGTGAYAGVEVRF